MKQPTRTKDPVLLALTLASLTWGCTSAAIHSREPADAGSDASAPDASDAAVDAGPCEPGNAGPRCSPCPAGSYCPGGTTPMALCGVNSFDADQNPKTPCVAASSCAAGTYVALLYSRVTDQRCAPCPSGTFSAQVNTRSCSVFRECGDAEYELQRPTSQHDRECAAWKPCEPGEYVSTQPTSSTDRGCSACAAGTFSTADNASQCQSWRVCEANELESAAPSSTRDRTCMLREECETGADEDAGTLPGACTIP